MRPVQSVTHAPVRTFSNRISQNVYYVNFSLFYVVGILILQTGQTGVLTLSLAWAYVALRCVHSYIHLTSNKVMSRFRVFLASFLVLVALWLTMFIGLVSAS
jgi:hypothetical protein